MPKQCAVSNCNSSTADLHLIFHRLGDGPRYLNWTKAIGRYLRGPSINTQTLICSKHFKKEDYTDGRGNLKKNVIPSLLLSNNGPFYPQDNNLTEPPTKKSRESDDDYQTDDSKTMMTENYAVSVTLDDIGKESDESNDIEDMHRLAKNCSFLVTVSEDGWEVKSGAGTQTVSKLQDEMCCDLVCHFCKICVHTYKCTCNDYSKSTICKHIHYIVINENDEDISDSGSVSSTDRYEDMTIDKNRSVSQINEIKHLCENIRDFPLERINEDSMYYIKESLKSVYNFLCTNNSEGSDVEFIEN